MVFEGSFRTAFDRLGPQRDLFGHGRTERESEIKNKYGLIAADLRMLLRTDMSELDVNGHPLYSRA